LALDPADDWHDRRQRADPVPTAFHRFGGRKRSLFGDMAVHGIEGMRFYAASRP